MDRVEKKIPKKSQIQKRFLFFACLFVLALLMVLVRYAILMIGRPELDTLPSQRSPVERGPILDRNGRILAMETRLGNISVWRPGIDDVELLSEELAPILQMSAGEIRERIYYSSSDFIYLKKQVGQSTIQAIETAKTGGNLRGVNIENIAGRIYPEQELAGQLIGFVGDDNQGLAGVEYAFETELTRIDPEQTGEESGRNNRTGNQVILTIDITVQHILEEIASRTLEEHQAEAVMFLAMDPRSGDVLGSASLPGFNPNNIKDSDENTRMDRPAIWAYEPGSVFKIFSLSALMDSGAINDDTVFVCNGQYERTTNLGEQITINCLAAHGPVTAREIIIYSCNAGAAYASDRLGGGSFNNLIRNFGFVSRTGAGNPGETVGFLQPVDRWSERSKPTIAMGQEIAVSALQMLQAATAVANDGILVPPRIISQIVSGDGKKSEPYSAGSPRRVLRAETARNMRQYMVDVTSNIGTGWRASIEDLSLAVKTGTAQIIDPLTGAYSDKEFIASCLAMIPAESPSLILYMVIIKPLGISYLGGRIATPPVREAAEALADYLGIPRGKNPQVVHSGSVNIPQRETPLLSDRVPDFSGYSKRSLLPLLLQDEIHIEITGEGWVRRQYPPPGTPLFPGDTITLELE
ncbi:MAG: transpeptidase family protein [Spirochaetaceae bacterium]|jgi:cell division protein FtsI (penicillin-binding protein 3)|nr:transpeptidase family protein [Spirochaetaceae bacterium]